MREIEEVRKIVSEAQIKRDTALSTARETYENAVAEIQAEYEESIKGARQLMTELQGIFGATVPARASKKTKKGGGGNAPGRPSRGGYRKTEGRDLSESIDADLVGTK